MIADCVREDEVDEMDSTRDGGYSPINTNANQEEHAAEVEIYKRIIEEKRQILSEADSIANQDSDDDESLTSSDSSDTSAAANSDTSNASDTSNEQNDYATLKLQPVNTLSLKDYVFDAKNAGTLKSKYCTLLIVGSDVPKAALSFIKSPSIAQFWGVYVLKSQSSQETANDLYELLDLQDWQIYETIQAISCLRYSRVRFFSKKDLHKIKHLFGEQWPELISQDMANYDFGPSNDESFLGVL